MAEKKMLIDGIECPFTNERNVLEVARKNGIDIPSLCYCENLSIYGGCRLCLVENDKGAMDAACSMKPKDGLVVYTHTKKVMESRRTTLQLLMSSHRADCLTCEQSGKCKLQDYAHRYNVEDTPFVGNTYCREPADATSPCIVRDPSKCILCGLCVRMCAEVQNVGAIDFVNRGKNAYVAPGFGRSLSETACVGCGQCAAVCPTGAITINRQIPKMWAMLHDPNKRVVVQFAPSVRVGMAEEFGMPADVPVTGKLVTALRRLGFDVVYDTNLSADLTIMEESAEFIEKVKSGAKLPMFTSCCPGWIQHVEHAHPHLMPQVSTCGSPMEMLGALIRKQFKDEDVYSVAIMPCTAKKFEAARPELEKDGQRLIDLVLTTDELIRMVKEAGIDFKNLPDSELDMPLGHYTGGGAIFGVTGGVTEAVIRRVVDDASPAALKTISECGVRGLEGIKAFEVSSGDLKIRIAVANGLANADRLIEKVEKGEEQFDFIEVMACPNGCIGGGGQPPATNARKAERFKAIFKEDDACEFKLPQQNPDLAYIYDELLQGRAHDLLHIHYPLHGDHH
ncbi:MAG: [Oscillospiraceae bacterium]|nr:[FeFe] hydrogenase, group A [Oscillospiraceae bacterium]